jgi:hypothetical protein
MAEGRDTKIVTVLETHMEVIQWTIEVEFCAVIGLQLLSKDMHGQALNHMLFDCHPIHVGLLPNTL